MYEEENEDYEILLWPLYFTSFLIDDFLDDEGMFGASSAILSSASSRTSSALAHLLHRRDGHRGGRSSLHRGMSSSPSRSASTTAWCPTRRSTSLDRKPSVYVDMSGDAKVRSAVHGHFGDELKHSAAVGITHREDLGGGSELARPEPRLLLRPDRLKKRTEDWGREGINQRLADAWREYVDWARGWLRVEHGSGPEDIERIYREMLDGKSDPAVGHVLSPATRPRGAAPPRSSSRSTRRITSALIRRSLRSRTSSVGAGPRRSRASAAGRRASAPRCPSPRRSMASRLRP